jgi:hypothetical protein
MSDDTKRWLGRAYALVDECNSMIDTVEFRLAMTNITSSNNMTFIGNGLKKLFSW